MSIILDGNARFEPEPKHPLMIWDGEKWVEWKMIIDRVKLILKRRDMKNLSTN